tara:strand:- start:17962 stop:19095 length:1134 start_codon:yes stop_codon:yes gene_type:complete
MDLVSNMGILADIKSNIETRRDMPSVGGGIMDNFKNTSRFTTEDLVNSSQNNLMPIPDQLGLNAMQRNTYGNFLANRVPEPEPVDPTTDPLTESITGKETMYGVPGAASAAVNMGGSLSGGGLGGFVAPVSARDMFVTDQAQSYEKSFEIDPEQDQVPSGTSLAPMPTKFSDVGPGTQFSNKGEMIQQGPNVTSGKYASSKGPKGGRNYLKALGESHAALKAQMEASRRNDLASAMQTLYGAAGSSFESGRNEYTESGDYARDKAIRDAEFDAMRAGNAPPTREETARRLAELQASIGFGGAMAPANDPMSTRVEPNPVPTNFELVSGYNVPAPIQGIPSLSTVNETTMSPVERNRRARLGRGRMMMNYGGIATFGL